VRHNDCKAKADEYWLNAYEALRDELRIWKQLAEINSDTILNIDNRLMPSPFGTSSEWRTLCLEYHRTLGMLANQFGWYANLILHDQELKKEGKNNEDA